MRVFWMFCGFILGFALLIPGACSLYFLVFGGVYPNIFGTDDPIEQGVVIIFWSGLIIAAFGIWLITLQLRKLKNEH